MKAYVSHVHALIHYLELYHALELFYISFNFLIKYV